MSEAVEDALVKVGMDLNDPLEMQRDMQHLREWRIAVGTIKSKGMLSIVALLVSGLVAAIWIGFKTLVTMGLTSGN